MPRPKLFFTLLCLFPDPTQNVFSQPAFQQRADHYIKARLIPEKKQIEVYDSLVYFNNSSDTLKEFYLHLWPQAYSNGRTELARQKAESGNTDLKYKKSFRGVMKFSESRCNGKNITWKYWKNNLDVVHWKLDSPLPPGASFNMVFMYELHMPSASISRLGVAGEDYMVTQWFPKPAVYDEQGWHPMPYLDQGEFYSEWGTYKVELEVPSHYVVAASGIPDPDYLQQLEFWSAQSKIFPKDPASRTKIRYVAENVHDFAWCASPSWIVERRMFADPISGEEKVVFAYYKAENASIWKGITEQGESTLSFFASYFRKPYPYVYYNIVDGHLAAGGGMEYPQLTIIGRTDSRSLLEEIVHHEIGHTWFQGILANNERDAPWLDEGLNTYFEVRYKQVKSEIPEPINLNIGGFRFNLGDKGAFVFPYFLWSALAKTGTFQAPNRYTSHHFTPINYFASVYQHTGFLFHYLEEVLGKEILDSAMRYYYERQAFRHTHPKDIQAAFEKVIGKNLSWFFQDLLNNNYGLDLRMSEKEISWQKNTRVVSIRPNRKQKIAFPIFIGSDYEPYLKKLVLWPDQDIVVSDSIAFIPGHLTIGRPFLLPDLNFRNNRWKLYNNKITRVQNFKIFPGFHIFSPYHHSLGILPVYGWNNNNKSMLGIFMSNYGIPRRQFQYYIMPLFSFNPHSLAGSAGFDVIVPFGQDSKPLKLEFNIHRYAYEYTTRPLSYLKNSFSVTWPLTHPRNRWRTLIDCKIEYFCVEWDNHIWLSWLDLNDRNRYFRSITEIRLEKNTRWNPIRHSLFLEGISEHSHRVNFKQTGNAFKVFQELEFSLFFIPKFRGFHFRFFQGWFPTEPTTFINTNFKLSGWPGFYDYTYSGMFWDRSAQEGFLSRQMVMADGGFRQFFSFNSRRYLAAVNAKMDFPNPVPARLFFDLGFTDGYYPTFNFKATRFFWSAGVTLQFLNESVAIHFPLIFSPALRYNLELNGASNLAQQIRFVFDLNKLNPRKPEKFLRFLN